MSLFQHFVSTIIKLIYENTDPYKNQLKYSLRCSILGLLFLLFYFEMRSQIYYGAKDGLKFLTLLSLPPGY